MAIVKNILNQRFGRLVVVRFIEVRNKNAVWECMCDCGKMVDVFGCNLKKGTTSSCGCFNIEATKQALTKHGQSAKNKTTEYTTWIGMKNRCYNKKEKSYKNYGGRGIKVCDRWLGRNGFENFFADMGNKPTPIHSIDRKDNEGDYCPENCRWGTQEQQSNNRRLNVFMTKDGLTLTISQWSKRLGISVNTLFSRIHYGFSDEKVLSADAYGSRKIGYKHAPETIEKMKQAWIKRKKLNL